MFDVSSYDFNIIAAETVKPEESFINFSVNECFESECTISATHSMRSILDAKYKKADLNKVINQQFQHLTLNHVKEF